MEIPENVHEGVNKPGRRVDLLPPLSQLIFFWCAFGVALINSRGWGCSKDYALCWSVELVSYCTGATPVFKAQCLPPNSGGFVSSWESCCCKDTGLLFGMYLG